ncbi:MAG: TIGR03862 family flavoprotein [Hyphomicrobiaceae bacterium]
MQSKVVVVGGGPAGLMAAEDLARAGLAVTVYDRMPTLGRKLLIAGRGGLNLTHGEPLDTFLSRYADATPWLTPLIRGFPPEQLRAWAEGLGQETFVGSSGRVFPRAMKASPLLRAWLARLAGLGVTFRTRHRWVGFDPSGALRFETGSPPETITVPADAVVLALGGASWPRLGSDGAWTAILAADGVAITPLAASNTGVLIDWSPAVRERFAGLPLKRIAATIGDVTVRGEAVITARGLEGGAIYGLSAALRAALAETGTATLTLDLRPDLTTAALADRLARSPAKQSLASRLAKAARLSPAQAAALREGAPAGGLPREPLALATAIKASPLRITGLAGLDRAISTAGGIRRDSVDGSLMLEARPGVFVAGEMLDWDAPTGGYLLQASFATGRRAAEGVCAWLGHAIPPPHTAPADEPEPNTPAAAD